MNEIRAILIDDEPSATESLAIELGMYCPMINVVATCNTPADGLAKIVSLKPDLVFLDIEMPGMNGFELLEQLNQVNFEVIFVTAFDEFAMKAIKFSAVDYLLKPVIDEDLITAVEKVEHRISNNLDKDYIDAVLTNVNFIQNNISTIAIPTMDGLEFLSVDEINYCEAKANYTSIHKLDGSSILLSKTLKSVEAMLEKHNFVRIHQTYLINISYLKKYIRGQGGYVIMKNGVDLPVSRNRKDEFLTRIMNG